MTNLTLHMGGKEVGRHEVDLVPTPSPVDGWYPIPHGLLIETVLDNLQSGGMVVKTMQHALNRNGQHYFGLLELVNGDGEFSTIVGLRNTHDRTWAAGLVVGSRVFVCDNLAFSGEIKIGRKHTRYIERDLPQLAAAAVGKLGLMKMSQEKRIDAYKDYTFEPAQANTFLLNTVRQRVLCGSAVAKALDLWDHPEKQLYEGDEPSGWRMFNAITETLKGRGITQPRKTQTLHGMMDLAVGGITLEGDYEYAA